MLVTITDRGDPKAPPQFAVKCAVCDALGPRATPSADAGGKDGRRKAEAVAADRAKQVGWVEHMETLRSPTGRPLRGGMGWVVQMFCPAHADRVGTVEARKAAGGRGFRRRPVPVVPAVPECRRSGGEGDGDGE